jgi:hypothetical protein
VAVHEVEFCPAPMVEKDLSCDPQMVLGYGPATAVQSLWNHESMKHTVIR